MQIESIENQNITVSHFKETIQTLRTEDISETPTVDCMLIEIVILSSRPFCDIVRTNPHPKRSISAIELKFTLNINMMFVTAILHRKTPQRLTRLE